ncbi:MAG: PEP/pyruvate-binding domain-containing protein [Kofleriaceae bacterium]|nr:PEP/pyruvate-binding domain-containing protein [Myxococcales bacterium]MCB9562296.1 PEP/pyruvate-binding domain-containing protein [Kofleriaceae bacterium]MCB9572098.1 PEP/pyruvate-binding domain-containing protein [Kofleriaceae bacterium]
MRALRLVPAVVVVLLALVATRPARADEQRAWVKTVPDDATWQKYARTLNADQFGKFIIDVKNDDIYFIDANLFELHADFVLGVLLKQAWTAENVREYNKNYERKKPRFILGYLTHHLKVGKYTFSFWEGDKIDAEGVLRVKQRLDETFFVKGADLPFRPDSPAQEKVAKEVAKKGLATITNDEIYKAADFQAFNLGEAVGTLRVVPVGTAYESLTFDRHDIVLLQESYPDITPVAGILATAFSTPLSHVNLRAGAWDIPNAGDKKARDKWGKLDGKVVYYQVKDGGAVVREATADEIAAMKTRIDQARHVDLPKADLTNPRLAMLTRIRAKDVTSYGTKTSNLGEIRTAGLADVHIPDGFGVPFFYYVRHMRQHHLDDQVEAMLDDPKFATDAAWRRQALETLRKAIVDAPIDPEVLDAIYKRVRIKLGGKGVFVRSSTNSEDLRGFNGAGLYDTVPNVKGKAALGLALKTVWASLWNLRAVEERTAFGIDHRQVYVGVLVQVGINATAAGVMVTTNLFDPRDDDGFTINAKAGLGIRVVEGQKVPEQIIFDATNDGTKIISRSDEPTMLVFDDQGGIKEVPVESTGVILTEERAKRLVDTVRKFIPLFPPDTPLDVEWVLEGEQVWIVQSRPYVGKVR